MNFINLLSGRRKKLVKNVDTIVDATLFRTDDILEARQAIVDQFDELANMVQAYENERLRMIEEMAKSNRTIVSLCREES